MFKNLGDFYIETVNIKVVVNSSNYNLSEIIYFLNWPWACVDSF
jgi:hypothetical protein